MKELLNDTLMELEKEEQMNVNGGGKAQLSGAAYGASTIASILLSLKYNCCYGVSMLSPAPYKGGGHICTWK